MSDTSAASSICRHDAADALRARRSSYEMLKLIEETGTVGFWSIDLITETFEGSAGCLRILGLQSGQPSSAMLGGMIHPEDRLANRDIWPLLRNGIGIDRELRILRRDRTARRVRIRAEVRIDRDNRPARADGIICDITEIDLMRAVSAHTQDCYRNLIEVTSCTVWHVSADGRLAPSEGWTRLTGQEPAEQGGSGWIEAIHPDDRDRVAREWREGIALRERIDLEFRVLCAAGGSRWHRCRLIPQFNRDGSLRDWFGGLTEIRERIDTGTMPAPPALGELSGSMVRAARGALNWSIADLARESGLSASTIKRLEERGSAFLRKETGRIVSRAFEGNGIVFLVARTGERFVKM